MRDLAGVLAAKPRALRGLAVAAILCGVLALAGLLVDPRRTWGGLLMGFLWIVSLGLAGGVFLSCLILSGARWATALKRIPEAMLATLPVSGAVGIVVLLGVPSLYEWAHPERVAASPLLETKASWLNVPFFCLRAVACFGIWLWAGRRLLRISRQSQAMGESAGNARNTKAAALFLALFAVTFSLASIDWIQSLEPEWFSTIFALVTASGLLTSGLAVVVIAAVVLKRIGPLRGILTADHLDDLGKIAMGFSLFWVYIWFCQYLLIWYTNMPEETSYYALRASAPWASLGPVNLVLNFAVPFFVLMPKRARRSAPVMLRVAIVMLIGHALDLYLLVAPSLLANGPDLRLWELAPILGCLALFSLELLRRLTEQAIVPENDPALPHSLAYHC